MSTKHTSPELQKLLSSIQVKNLPTLKDQTVMEFGKDDLIRDAFEALVNNSFLSAPVYDSDTKKYIGMVDLRDIVGFVLSLKKNNGPIVFTVDKLVNFSGMDKFQPIAGDATLLQALEEFAKSQIHRMPIMKNETQIDKILTQSAIVQFLAQSANELGSDVNKTVGELEKELGGVAGIKNLLLNIKETDSVETAFELMQKYNVHGVGVVDKDGKLIGNISVMDMQYFVKWDIETLRASARDYFDNLNVNRLPLVTCTLQTKFLDVLKLVVEKKVHRIHVVDENLKPVDIITLTNILDTVFFLATGKKF